MLYDQLLAFRIAPVSRMADEIGMVFRSSGYSWPPFLEKLFTERELNHE